MLRAALQRRGFAVLLNPVAEEDYILGAAAEDQEYILGATAKEDYILSMPAKEQEYILRKAVENDRAPSVVTFNIT